MIRKSFRIVNLVETRQAQYAVVIHMTKFLWWKRSSYAKYRAQKYGFCGGTHGIWYNEDSGHIASLEVGQELDAALRRKKFNGVTLV
ncbi:hypothetical protein AU106_gp199 [Sinorhizobium phage phiM9]|uniref:Uncharacterized protein n=1 Tax=Sinorhizobium phage phiM9 TaxID=1636182 RepID=A0A0F6R618_9CAUD|nr:hypothetical protein AU106_gp199 [Sinorhizobium phage phiM9]AKE44830.1 hypothetical protein Sm_phiM9_203 [Sinorhizobium phage phiM9]